MLWFILHEIKHAIDSASNKDTLKEPDLSTPEKFRAYKKHPSERRAEAFAKRVIMLVAAESGPSLIEATRMFFLGGQYPQNW
jgi:Zn-dependent peptidase ImmA (M78 family)